MTKKIFKDRSTKPGIFSRLIKFGIKISILLTILGGVTAAGIYLYISPNLPSVGSLKDIRFQVPLRVYSADGKLMGEFGDKRREPLRYDQIPEYMVNAVVGAEDDRFFEHPGVDYHGLLRAVAVFVTTGRKAQGGSTITMQVARNFFLSREKTFLRKFSEILLALRIEQTLTKQEIIALYLNKIYLGNRAYGVGAAANIYYGESIEKLHVSQLAMIAGLPKAPSRYNPIINPTRALQRRNYVLGRMLALGYIEKEIYDDAILRPVTAELRQKGIELDAPYAAEMVRNEMFSRYGTDAYTEGYSVYTTLESRLQNKATRSLQYNLLAYEERHGYRGAEQKLDELDFSEPSEWKAALKKVSSYPILEAGVVIEVNEDSALVYMANDQVAHVCWRGLKWAARYIDGNRIGFAPKEASEVVAVGDVIRLYDAGGGRWSLGQIPEVEGALVSVSAKNGAIQAIVGGYDFYHSKFNRAAQAKRQPGSNFKPFVYSGALEKGYTAATLINDAPVVFNDSGLEESWRPENYSGKIFGETRLREALVKSRNLVSIRILQDIGIRYAINYVKRFGFDPAELPKDLSLALGSATLTPLEVVRGYAAFANGGYLVETHLIDRIVGPGNELLYKANPPTVCPKCELAASAEEIGIDPSGETVMVSLDEMGQSGTGEPVINLAKRIVSAQNVYIMTTILREIIQRGTGRRAKVLRRNDLAGKTGTTNDQRDAWFSGFNAEIATTAWVGFDKPHPLGDNESGARAALPMWITYMREALKGMPETPLVQPPGIVTVRIDPETGLRADAGFDGAIFESFRTDHVPKQMSNSNRPRVSGENSASEDGDEAPEQLF
ncbi:MAG: penicillin-binding protein 1A [Gammaproteobacteria bacterium]|nr:penicillin-binding protein 1A [Gammaproteobacteria bacterium]